MALRKNCGFTLVELIVIISIIAALAGVVAAVFISLMRMFVCVPKEAAVRFVACQVQDTLLEGDGEIRGLRFASSLITIGGDEVVYSYGDASGSETTVAFRWDSGDEKLYRQVDGGSEAVIPYEFGDEISVKRKDGTDSIFIYYDSNGQETTDSALVERLKVDMAVETGSGSFTDWEASLELSSGVDIKRY